MPSLVSRFHLLLFGVTLAIAGVILVHVPSSFTFAAHWRGSVADLVWPRDLAIAVAPLLQATLLAAFFALGCLLSKNHFAKVQHILDPLLTLLLAVPTACQLALALMAIGSDLDFFRVTAFGLAATLLVFAAIIHDAERHTYAGLRMPWTIRSDRAWRIVHLITGLASMLAAIALAALAWLDPGPAFLVMAMALSLTGLPALSALTTLALHRA